MKLNKLNRKIHRYLGIIIGVQFLFWTISGLYFSWTNLDDIHGDTFKIEKKDVYYDVLLGLPFSEYSNLKVKSIELRDIAEKPYFWINDSILIDATTGRIKAGVTKKEALQIAKTNIVPELQVSQIDLIETVHEKHEYRNKKTPVYRISYHGDDHVTAYVSKEDGKFQSVRHDRWRIFDFLWMTHTMDYEGKDNINNLALRIFSIFGLLTTLSGFLLFFTSNKNIMQFFNKNKSNQ